MGITARIVFCSVSLSQPDYSCNGTGLCFAAGPVQLYYRHYRWCFGAKLPDGLYGTPRTENRGREIRRQIYDLSALMAIFMLLLFLLSAAASDQEVVTVHPGDDVILPCQAADYTIGVVEWSRPDLDEEYILLYRDGHFDQTHQHPEFKDRVDLVDRDLKDGDASLILKAVRSIDTGIYECRVIPVALTNKNRLFLESEPIGTIRLQVTGFKDGHSMNAVPEGRNSSPVGRYRGLAAGVPVGLILVAAAVVGVLIF
ncbi:coxsackievirus and adenovirus receptor-like [Perca flavescens]|uniref:coxsackievirus and adenovirus receptor-like n=1 Tax=Perca flavescens TaxID=8167 RepID=UPI00106E445F|nr:coxsackievirus and adenovirus receptor-like [Perca flavescens]